MLSEAFAAGKTPDAIANSTAEQMAAQLKAIVRTHALVTDDRARYEARAHGR